MYCSKFIDEALEDIKKLPKNVRNALKKEFEKKVHVNPVECSEPLFGMLESYRSFHYRDYRVVYRVFEDIRAVSVIGVGKKDKTHRTDLYNRLEDLAKKGRLAEAILETYRVVSL
ncbi:MAG: type II toxin-antitoxin system RelE/ParE family toxin [Candidatus Acidiferrales bacterium]